MTETMTDLEMRKRRALYRANHRGIKEMDILIGRYAEHALLDMTLEDLEVFEELLSISDRELESWIMHGTYEPNGEFAPILGSIREYHDIG